MTFFNNSDHDTTFTMWGKLLLVWLSTIVSRETLSYVLMLASLAYTFLLIITLLRDKWFRPVAQRTKD